MGRAAKLNKDRKCESCGTMMYTSAEKLKEHLAMCRIAHRSGLVLPGGVDRPGGLVDPSGQVIRHD